MTHATIYTLLMPTCWPFVAQAPNGKAVMNWADRATGEVVYVEIGAGYWK